MRSYVLNADVSAAVISETVLQHPSSKRCVALVYRIFIICVLPMPRKFGYYFFDFNNRNFL